MGTENTTAKSMLVVFEGDGTLWWRPGPKEKPEGDLVTRGKHVVQMRPGLREVLTRMLESDVAIGIWTIEASNKVKQWLPDILGRAIFDRLLFSWFGNRTTGVGNGVIIKESAQVAAAFPQYGYGRTLFVSHDYLNHCLSLPGNLVLVRPFTGTIPDIFLEAWVWKIVRIIQDEWLAEPSPTSTVPHFLFNTNRPAERACIEEIRALYPGALKTADQGRPLVYRQMEKHSHGASTARSAQQQFLEEQKLEEAYVEEI
jgi:hypothetical protein